MLEMRQLRSKPKVRLIVAEAVHRQVRGLDPQHRADLRRNRLVPCQPVSQHRRLAREQHRWTFGIDWFVRTPNPAPSTRTVVSRSTYDSRLTKNDGRKWRSSQCWLAARAQAISAPPAEPTTSSAITGRAAVSPRLVAIGKPNTFSRPRIC